MKPLLWVLIVTIVVPASTVLAQYDYDYNRYSGENYEDHYAEYDAQDSDKGLEENIDLKDTNGNSAGIDPDQNNFKDINNDNVRLDNVAVDKKEETEEHSNSREIEPEIHQINDEHFSSKEIAADLGNENGEKDDAEIKNLDKNINQSINDNIEEGKGDVEVKEEIQPFFDKDSEKLIQKEIDQFLADFDESENNSADNFDDYQVEDNRSDRKEVPSDVVASPVDSDGSFEQVFPALEDPGFGKNEVSDLDQIIAEAKRLLKEENSDFEDDIERREPTGNEELDEGLESNESNNERDHHDDGIKDDYFDDIIESQNNQEIEKIKLLTKFIDLRESNEDDIKEKSDEESKKKPKDELDNPEVGYHGDLQYVKDMIDPMEPEADDDTDGNTDTNNHGIVEDSKIIEEELEDEDSVDKAYQDLNADLQKLFTTWNKLTADDTKEDTNDKIGVLEYEEKFGKPFGESEVLAQRDELYDSYADITDNNFKDLTDVIEEVDSSADVNSDNDDTINNETDEEIKGNGNDDAENDSVIEVEKDLEVPVEQSNFGVKVKSIDVLDLNPEQYKDLMSQFQFAHANELDTQSEDFSRDSAPIHIAISADEITEITSPNFPNAYPSNDQWDWILEGEGMGIELNVTDLDIRGVQGDYLLIKPGGVDASGQEGLIFSYQLNEPRKYRFISVDRMFVRFNAGTGWPFTKGFRITVKMIWPPVNQEDEQLPEAESLLPAPSATMSVNLGGVIAPQFMEVKADFQRIVADMATMYINANNIDGGLNSTSETTQITNVASCNVNWPNFVECVEVTFGVPLVYEDEDTSRLNETDLRAMWETYVNVDPFAVRLRAMGIMEFAVPNDNRVMLTWLVLGFGIIVCAIMLAFALWRYSCFEDYTRMKTFGDTDSIREEKRGLDLYPTPHQTLPPLYADSDYKWADANQDDTTRVDLGGYTNRSYNREELFDIDSDEEVVTKRDRNAGFSPRDVYQV